MNKNLTAIALLLAACGDNRPPAPSADESRRLDEAEAMLNEEVDNGEGPVSEPTDPSDAD